jgi:hypothetical protein
MDRVMRDRVIDVPILIGAIYLLFDGLKNGRVIGGGKLIAGASRRENPFRYWLLIATFGAAVCLMIYQVIH